MCPYVKMGMPPLALEEGSDFGVVCVPPPLYYEVLVPSPLCFIVLFGFDSFEVR